jgi:hypothetical protein
MSTIETKNREHTIIDSPLGELTVVREAEALTGLCFHDHQYAPDRLTLGPRADAGFEASHQSARVVLRRAASELLPRNATTRH